MLRPALLLLASLLVAPFASAEGALWLGRMDPAELRRADELRLERGSMAHVAAARAVDVDPWSAGEWSVDRVGRARWRLEVVSRGATTLAFAFDVLRLPPGARLEIQGRDGYRQLVAAAEGAEGVEGAEAVVGRGRRWTPPAPGERAVLELEVAVEAMEQVELRLSEVIHGYVGIGPWGATSGACQVDAACGVGRDWDREAASVVSLLVAGVRTCSGVLLASTAGDDRPLVATAAHCGIDRETAGSVVAWFGHRAEVCGSPSAVPLGVTTGARLLARIPELDLVLLELDEPPPAGARWAGWDRTENGSVAAPVAVLHHPGSDRLKVALSAPSPDPARWLGPVVDAPGPAADHFRIPGWTLGTTEGGSSGAPLFNAEGRVIGLLRGGWAACGNREADWFARLGAAWDGPTPSRRLRDWLDPEATDAPSVDGHPRSDIGSGAGR